MGTLIALGDVDAYAPTWIDPSVDSVRAFVALQHAPIRDLQRIPVGPITRAPLNDDHDAPGAVETGPRVSEGTRCDGCCRRDQQG